MLKKKNSIILLNLTIALMTKGYNQLYINKSLTQGINYQLKSQPKLWVTIQAHKQLEIQFEKFLRRNQLQEKKILNNYLPVSQLEFEQLETSFKDWIVNTTLSQKIVLLIVMKEKTWLNTVGINFYPFKLASKGAQWYFLKVVLRQGLLNWQKETNSQNLSIIIKIYLRQMMEKRRYKKRKRNHGYN